MCLKMIQEGSYPVLNSIETRNQTVLAVQLMLLCWLLIGLLYLNGENNGCVLFLAAEIVVCHTTMK